MLYSFVTLSVKMVQTEIIKEVWRYLKILLFLSLDCYYEYFSLFLYCYYLGELSECIIYTNSYSQTHYDDENNKLHFSNFFFIIGKEYYRLRKERKR